MILKRIKSNSQLNLIVFPFFAILLWLRSVLAPFGYQFYDGESEMLLFAPLYNLIEEYYQLQVIVSLLLAIILGAMVQAINDRYSFIRIRTKLPASLYVIIIAGFMPLHTIHPVYFGALFMLWATYELFGTFDHAQPYGKYFNCGFILGIGSLFYLNLIVLFPAFLIGINVLNKERNWRNQILMIIGLIATAFFAFSYVVLADAQEHVIETLRSNILTPVNHFRRNIAMQGYLFILVFFTLLGSIRIIQQYDTKKISTRKYFSFFLILFVFSMISFVFIPVTSQEMLIIAAIPVTFLMSNMLVFMKSRFWSEFLFVILLAMVVFMQVSDKYLWYG